MKVVNLEQNDPYSIMIRGGLIHRLAISLVLFVILVGCGTMSSTGAPTSIVPRTSHSAPAVEETNRPPIFTARPSSTPLPSFTPNQTQTAIFQDGLAAQSAEQTSVAQYPRVCNNINAPRKFSPNRLWLEELCYSEADQNLILTLSKKDSQVLWKLAYEDYIQSTEIFPDGGLAVIHWPSDGRYAYFASYNSGDGGECFVGGNTINSGWGLFRLDLQTGDVTTILPPQENYRVYGFSFSPTDRRLIYRSRSSGLNVLDINTGQLIQVVPVSEYDTGGGYIWSPDGLMFVYSTVFDTIGGDIISYSLRLVDSQSGSERIILESTENCFAARAWSENNILTIESYDKTMIER